MKKKKPQPSEMSANTMHPKCNLESVMLPNDSITTDG